MDNDVWLARILTFGAVLEIGTGIGLLLIPSRVASFLLRAPLEGAGLVVGRVAGGALLALGIACWYASQAPDTPAGLGVARAFFVYNIVVCYSLAQTRPALGNGDYAVLAVIVIHGFLAAALLVALL